MNESDQKTSNLEIAHVLFMDVVSYSLLPTDHQSEVIQRLQQIVRVLPDFEQALAAQQMIYLPTGDGMALAFFRDPIAPLRCARQIALVPKEFEIRMGIHSGPIYRHADINASANVAGGGINFAQRVMDCGDAGHILASKAVAEVLLQLSQWKGAVHSLGEHEVKHAVRIEVFNIFNEEFGNPQIPSKLLSVQVSAGDARAVNESNNLPRLRDIGEAGPQVARVTVEPRVKQRSTLWLWAILVVLVLAAGIYFRWWVLKAPALSFERLTYRRGDVPAAKFSPDGQTVFFSAQWANEPPMIFSLRPGSRESRPLDLPSGRILSISSLGEMAILLGAGNNGVSGILARVSISGGAPREILENVNDADWSPDGSSLAVSRTVGRKNLIEYPIGTIRYENEGRPPLSVRISPKGGLIAFFEYDSAAGDYAVTVLDQKGQKRILSRGWRAEDNLNWTPKGNEIWFGGTKTGGETALHAVSLSGKERVVAEAPAWMAMDDITRDGKVLVTVVDSRMGISALAPGATQERDLSWFDASRIFDISADGKIILFAELTYGKDRNPAIYLRKTDGSPAVRLGNGNRPALSSDGKWVVCTMSDGAKTDLTLLPTGPGEVRSIGIAGMHYERAEWFPDGQRILFTGNERGRPLRTFIQDLKGGKPTPITPEGMPALHISPEGKYVIAVADSKLSLFAVTGGEPKTIAGFEGGDSVICWSGDGRSLFVRRMEGPSALKIERLDVETGRRQVWRELKIPDPVGVQIGEVVMTPDGNTYAYSFQRDISTLYLVLGIK